MKPLLWTPATPYETTAALPPRRAPLGDRRAGSDL